MARLVALRASNSFVGLPVAFFGAFWIDMEKGEVHRRQIQAEIRSGRYSFGDQPALLAVAQAISANDQNAIRVAAKNVSDLQSPGRDGTTLLVGPSGKRGSVLN
jgi:hypothetical protein